MDHVKAFLDWSEKDRKRSPHTIKRYAAVLEQIEDPIHAELLDIEQWWATRLEKSEATRSNELACLRAFYKWATRFGHIDVDPTRRLDPPKVAIKQPRPIGKSDLRKLMDAAPDDMRRALALGAFGGMRISEACTLDWKDIDQEARRIYITGKGRKERVFAMSMTLWDEIAPAVEGNVVTAGGKPHSPAVLTRRINRFIEKHSPGHTFHDLRKRGASLAMEKGGDPVAVTKAFGWSSVNTAMHYHQTSEEALDRIAEAIAW